MSDIRVRVKRSGELVKRRQAVVILSFNNDEGIERTKR